MKNRLFEIFDKVNNTNINKLSTIDKNYIIDRFIKYADEYLKLQNNLPEIRVDFEKSNAKEVKSFGGYIPSEFKIEIVGYNRNLADTLRTLAHELVHHKQNIEDSLYGGSGETGSDHENEANSLAGIMLREFGKNNPVIYE